MPAASRIIDRMVEHGLVRRRKHETDGRIMVVTLADRGRKLVHLADFHARINAALLKGFSPEDRERTFELLCRMQQNAENALEENPA